MDKNAHSYGAFLWPLILLCVEVVVVAVATGAGMAWDLKGKQFAVWHRNAAGYIFKTFVGALVLLSSLLMLRNIIVRADEDLPGFVKTIPELRAIHIAWPLFLLLLISAAKVPIPVNASP